LGMGWCSVVWGVVVGVWCGLVWGGVVGGGGWGWGGGGLHGMQGSLRMYGLLYWQPL